MSDNQPNDVTRLLEQHARGDASAMHALLPVIYQELKKIASAYMRKESKGQTLQATALVHEAFFRLLDQKETDWKNRQHFFAIAAQQMRRVLVDHARAKKAEKRGGGNVIHVDIELAGEVPMVDEDMEDLDAALTELATLNERQAKIVEIRYFAGLSIEETAAVMEISPATVKREWTVARAWLYNKLKT